MDAHSQTFKYKERLTHYYIESNAACIYWVLSEDSQVMRKNPRAGLFLKSRIILETRMVWFDGGSSLRLNGDPCLIFFIDAVILDVVLNISTVVKIVLVPHMLIAG